MFYAVIMAGGSGTRLWPLSRESRPKQSLKLVGERTLFQHAVDRLAPLFPHTRILTVTRASQVPLLSGQVPDLPAENFIVEPQGRGTAPAIGLAAVHLQRRDPGAVMAVLTADHFIADLPGFHQALAAAEKVAESGALVTLGIRPSSASTGYGYIRQAERLGTEAGLPVYRVERFIEKPDPESAVRMLASGQYSWNSGMFIWRVERILEEFERQMPGFHAQLGRIAAAIDTPAYAPLLAGLWPQVARQTIDYGVMEGARSVAVIPVDIGWTDVGSWGSLRDLLPADGDGNILVGPYLGIDTHNTLVFGGRRLVATLGVQDLVIVDTEDALLVCSRAREQEVRALVDRLKAGQQDQWL